MGGKASQRKKGGEDIPGRKRGVSLFQRVAIVGDLVVFFASKYSCFQFPSVLYFIRRSQREREGLGRRFLPSDIRGPPYYTILVYHERLTITYHIAPHHTILIYEEHTTQAQICEY